MRGFDRVSMLFRMLDATKSEDFSLHIVHKGDCS